MSTFEKRRNRAEQQQRRRMASRRCGNCLNEAEEMLDWMGQTIPICLSCNHRLGIPPSERFCAFDEVSPLVARPPVPVPTPAAVEVADGPDEWDGAEESVGQRLVSWFRGR